MTEPLNLYHALELYDILKSYLPAEIDEQKEAITFILELVDGMTNEQGAEDFFEVINLTGVEVPENAGAPEYMNAFIEGLSSNSIVSLSDFSSKLGL